MNRFDDNNAIGPALDSICKHFFEHEYTTYQTYKKHAEAGRSPATRMSVLFADNIFGENSKWKPSDVIKYTLKASNIDYSGITNIFVDILNIL